MGYGIMAYSVRIEHLEAPSTFTADPADFLDWMMKVHSATVSTVEARTALKELFFGEPHSGSNGADYGYALKVLCKRFGGALNNGHWYPLGSNSLTQIGAELKRLGVPLDPASALVYAGSPVPIPEIDDFPGIGYLTSAAMVPIARALDSADLDTVEDQNTRGAIAELKEWVHFCAQDGSDLVTFYH